MTTIPHDVIERALDSRYSDAAVGGQLRDALRWMDERGDLREPCSHEWHVDPLRVMVYQGEAHRLAACAVAGCFAVAVVPHDYTTAIPLHSDPADWPMLPKRLHPSTRAQESR